MIQLTTRFAKLLTRVQPNPAEVARARRQVGMIRARINNAFRVSKIVLVGSHQKGTAIRTFSDVDVFVVLRREAVRWGDSYVAPDTLLRRIRDELRGRFPSTEVRRDQQAVVIQFAQGEHSVDVVPAVFEKFHNMPLYLIPDGAGGWLRTSPEAHSAYFKKQNKRSGAKLRKTVQLLKHWCCARDPHTPLLSFHAEIVMAVAGLAVGTKSFPELMSDALSVLAGRAGAAVRDPLHVAGPIPATKTVAQRRALIAKLEYSESHAEAAIDAEKNGDWREAVRQWGIVFNGEFPP